MDSHENNSKEETRRVLESLRGLVEKGGQAVLEDLNRYFSMCLKAEGLRRKGLQVRVRGEWQRWLIVIERERDLGTSLRRVCSSGGGFLFFRGGRYEAAQCQRMRGAKKRRLSIGTLRRALRVSRDRVPPLGFLER